MKNRKISFAFCYRRGARCCLAEEFTLECCGGALRQSSSFEFRVGEGETSHPTAVNVSFLIVCCIYCGAS